MKKLSKNNGITMVALVITIIVILIIASITITQGSGLMQNTRVETYVTDMITIRAKAKVYAEEVNSSVWDEEDKVSARAEKFSEKYNMTKPTNEEELESKVGSNINKGNGLEFYQITKSTLSKMGLEDLAKEFNDGDYVIVFDASDYKNLDVIYTPGVKKNQTMYYTLSSLQENN